MLRALALDQLDLVAVGILDERDDGRPPFDRSRFARDLRAVSGRPVAHAGASRRDVADLDRDVTEAAAELVRVDAVVVCELEHRTARLVAVADERESVLLLG